MTAAHTDAANELAAMRRIVRELDRLDKVGQTRVMRHLTEWYGNGTTTSPGER